MFGVCVCWFVTDRLSLSEIMADTDPPLNSLSHHRISFFPSLSLSLSLTNTQSFSLCSHPVRSLAFSLCLSYTHALSLSSLRPLPLVSAAVTRCPFRSVILSAAVRELAGGPTEMSGNRFCPERCRTDHNRPRWSSRHPGQDGVHSPPTRAERSQPTQFSSVTAGVRDMDKTNTTTAETSSWPRHI